MQEFRWLKEGLGSEWGWGGAKVGGGGGRFIARRVSLFFSRERLVHTHNAKDSKGKLMKTIFVPSQRTRSPSHNCQSCNKSLCGTNEYGIGNETKLIGMLCQLDSIHPSFHTRPFICEVVRGCLSVSYSHTHTHRDNPSLSSSGCTLAHRLHVKVAEGVNVCGRSSRGLPYITTS